VAHARIKRIDAAAARRMPGVLFVATGEDEPLPAVTENAQRQAIGPLLQRQRPAHMSEIVPRPTSPRSHNAAAMSCQRQIPRPR
jgi:CO/xanthine dehydrogenase Mo-binding subunit